jgi:2',3'-cyclic-nucleotide 2'-phosphodiesterase (5'-nucleotidase family)
MTFRKRCQAPLFGFALLLAAALVFMACPTDAGDDEDAYNPYPGLDWGKIAAWDGSDATTVLGTASAEIGSTGIRYQETAFGNLVVDGIAAYAEYVSGAKVDFAIHNGQNVQGLTAIPAGEITVTNLNAGLADRLLIATITGQNVLNILNVYIKSNIYGTWQPGCVALVSKGVSYTITPKAGTPSGYEVLAANIKVNGSAIDLAKNYKVALGNFIAGYKDDGSGPATSSGAFNFARAVYDADNGAANITVDNTYAGETLKQAVAKYILAKGTISPVVEGRITGTLPPIAAPPPPLPAD